MSAGDVLELPMTVERVTAKDNEDSGGESGSSSVNSDDGFEFDTGFSMADIDLGPVTKHTNLSDRLKGNTAGAKNLLRRMQDRIKKHRDILLHEGDVLSSGDESEESYSSTSSSSSSSSSGSGSSGSGSGSDAGSETGSESGSGVGKGKGKGKDKKHKQGPGGKQESTTGGQMSELEAEMRGASDKATADAFFERDNTDLEDLAHDFNQLNLSRPLLRALRDKGFVRPFPIQSRVIPVALTGRDVCASAVTGSGKTAAFVLPALERLQFRSRSELKTRVLVLVPTRELAVQCYSVFEDLSRYTDVTLALTVGGFSMQDQQRVLKAGPDVVVATPGRLIDHIENTRAFSLSNVEILIMDEADRLLDEGFQDELDYIVKATPKSRQTMLFSATMTEDVTQLVKVALNVPVRISADAMFNMADNLRQEFVRIRPNREDSREAIVLALAKRNFKERTVVFIRTKKGAHRLFILFGLFGLKAAELHGNLTQTQRVAALESFRAGEVSFLIATDVASRGLDIQGVKSVINMSMPSSVRTYVHRVGRTARAGNDGSAVTLVADKQRTVLRKVTKLAKRPAAKRTLAPEVIQHWQDKIDGVADTVKSILDEEYYDKQLKKTEKELDRAANLIKFADDIAARPAKTWFQTKTEKETASAASLANYLEETVGHGSSQALKVREKVNKRRRKASGEDTQPAPKKRRKLGKHNGLSRKQRRRKQMLAEMEAEGLLRTSHESNMKASKRKFQAASQRMTVGKASREDIELVNPVARRRAKKKAKKEAAEKRRLKRARRDAEKKKAAAEGGAGGGGGGGDE